LHCTTTMHMKRIAIFASGNGTNAQRIIDHFKGRKDAEVVLILSNKKQAKVLERAKEASIPALSFNRPALYDSDIILNILEDIQPDLIVLAGFLWLFPDKIINLFPNKVINIHPALLPQFGGKGMYGMHVHRAVCAFAKAQKETVYSGISIHYVTSKYDEGALIFQAKIPVSANETPETLAKKIHLLEHEHFPEVIERLLNGQ